jgi:hypothetical protein
MSEGIFFLFGCVKHLTGDRGDYLVNARHKYFFNDSDAPSFRLLEDEDDNGKLIEEPELYRPIGMDDCSYNKQIEVSCLPICLCYHFLVNLCFFLPFYRAEMFSCQNCFAVSYFELQEVFQSMLVKYAD